MDDYHNGGMMSGRSDASSSFSIDDEEYMFEDEILPEGWCRFFDDLTGQWYFVEMNTMRSSWIKPTMEGGSQSLPPITRAPKKKRNVPKTYQTSATQVPDIKLMTVAEVPRVGPAYPDRQQPLTKAIRQQFGIPSVPSRCSKDENNTYTPYEAKALNTAKINTKWVNIDPPAPLVPVHRPVWDDREFWTLCEGDAELAQRYNDFWLACYNGDEEAVRFYLEEEELDHAATIPLGWSSKHNKQLRGATPLHIAVDGNFYHVAKMLLSCPMQTWGVVIAKPSKEELDIQNFYNKKKNIIRNGSRQKQKLDFTVKSNYFNQNNGEDDMDESLKLNILVKDNQGMTPLLIAIKRGNFKMVNMLIKHDKTNYHINECRDLTGATPMHYACGGGHLDIVQLLYNKANGNLLSRNHRGITPLLLAERNGHANIVAWLLEQPEVPWDDVDDNGMSLLMVAAERGDAGLIRDICLTTSYRILKPDTREPVDPDDPSTFPINAKALSKSKGKDTTSTKFQPLPYHAAALYIQEEQEEAEILGSNGKPVSAMNALARAEALMAKSKALKEETSTTEKTETSLSDNTKPLTLDIASNDSEGGGLVVPPITASKQDSLASSSSSSSVIGSPSLASPTSLTLEDKRQKEEGGNRAKDDINSQNNTKLTNGSFPLSENSSIDQTKVSTSVTPQQQLPIKKKAVMTTTSVTGNPILGDKNFIPRVLVEKHKRVWLDRKDKSGRSALTFAALNGHLDVVEILLSQKGRDGRFGRQVWLVDENAKNGSSLGMRPVDAARTKGHRKVQLYLIQVSKDRVEEEKERRKQIIHGGKPLDGEPPDERRTIPL